MKALVVVIPWVDVGVAKLDAICIAVGQSSLAALVQLSLASFVQSNLVALGQSNLGVLLQSSLRLAAVVQKRLAGQFEQSTPKKKLNRSVALHYICNGKKACISRLSSHSDNCDCDNWCCTDSLSWGRETKCHELN